MAEEVGHRTGTYDGHRVETLWRDCAQVGMHLPKQTKHRRIIYGAIIYGTIILPTPVKKHSRVFGYSQKRC